MGAFICFWQDAWALLQDHKRKVLLCSVMAVVGTVLGVVFYSLGDLWWCVNRTNFVFKLVSGGVFSLVVTFLLSAVAVSFACCLFSMWRWTVYLCYPFVMLLGIYFGAHCGVACGQFGLLGVLYVLLLLIEQLLNMLCCFLVLTNGRFCRTVKEALCDCKPLLTLQAAGVLFKLLFLLIIRLLSSII